MASAWLRPLPLRAGALGCGAILLVAIALWWTAGGDGRLHVIVPPIAGDGMLLLGPRGEVALIDGGADGSAVASWLGDELPLGQRHIDLLLLTRADETTLPGQLAAVRRYRIGQALLAMPVEPQPLWDELVRLLEEQGTPVREAQEGDRLRLGAAEAGSAMLQILAATEGRLSVALAAGGRSVLFYHSVGDEPLPRSPDFEPAAVFYPWRRTTHDPDLEALRPEALIFGERPGTDPHMTLAERRIGAARLLHEALDGRIDLQFGQDGMQIAVGRQHGR